MSKESIQGPLSALRNAGTVCGVCLVRGPEILVNLFPFSEARINDMVSAVDDIQTYFAQKNRQVDQMSFGYDGGCLCIVEDDEFRLIVMHMLADEVDFIAKASRAFLADFHLDLFAEQIASGNTRLTGLVSGNNPPESLLAEGEEPSSPMDLIRKRESAQSAEETSEEEESDAQALEKEENDEQSSEEDSGEASDSDESESESVEMIDLDSVSDSEEDEEGSDDVHGVGARLADSQPESTLPPPRRPKLDRD